MERSKLYSLSFTELLKLKKHFISVKAELYPMVGNPPTDEVMNREYTGLIKEIDTIIFNKYYDLKTSMALPTNYDPN